MVFTPEEIADFLRTVDREDAAEQDREQQEADRG
jgi:hypothetical protein